MSMSMVASRKRAKAVSDARLLAVARKLHDRGIHPSGRKVAEIVGMWSAAANRRIDLLRSQGRWPHPRRAPPTPKPIGKREAKMDAVLEAASSLVRDGIYPSHRRVAAHLGLSLSTIIRRVRRLKASGRWPKDVPSVRPVASGKPRVVRPLDWTPPPPANTVPDPTPEEIRAACIAIRKSKGLYAEPLQRWETR